MDEMSGNFRIACGTRALERAMEPPATVTGVLSSRAIDNSTSVALVLRAYFTIQRIPMQPVARARECLECFPVHRRRIP